MVKEEALTPRPPAKFISPEHIRVVEFIKNKHRSNTLIHPHCTSTQYKLSSSTIVYLHYLLFISLHTLRLELTAIHCTYFWHKDLCLMLLLPTASLHYRNQSHTKTMLCHSYRDYNYCLSYILQFNLLLCTFNNVYFKSLL